MSQTSDPFLYRKITHLYLLALTAVAVLTIGGQILMQQSLHTQQSDSRVVNVAGRQRMLSQKITKTVILLTRTSDSEKARAYLTELDNALDLWQVCHTGLKEGNLAHINTPVLNSPAIEESFKSNEPHFQALYKNARFISHYFHNIPFTVETASLKNSLSAILQAEPKYLKGMERIVLQYEQEAAHRVSYSQNVELLLLWATLFILALEGLFIFRPAVNEIRKTIGKLMTTERQTYQANQQLIQTNRALEETKQALVQATEQKYQRELNEQKLRATYLIEGQEEERKRVSKEIHDGLGQMLTALKFGIEKVSDSVNPTEKAQKDVAALRELVSQTIAEARSISFDLMPAVLNDFGVSSALKLLTSQLAASTGKTIRFNSNYTGHRLPKNIEIGLYRIGQEALHNALKYAQAEEITVGLSVKKKHIHFMITDNGSGFDYASLKLEAAQESPSHGISNMKERVYLLNGHMEINSVPGSGTCIHVKIPSPTQFHEQD